jgi:hypothetical protein
MLPRDGVNRVHGYIDGDLGDLGDLDPLNP